MESPLSNAADALDSSWRRRVEIIEQFEDCWQDRQEADIVAFASQVPPDANRKSLLVELVKVDLEYRLRRGEPVCVEGYVERLPEVGTPGSLPRDLIAEEIRVRALLGRFPSLDELLRRFPGREAELADLLAEATPRDLPAPLDSSARVETDLSGLDSRTPVSAHFESRATPQTIETRGTSGGGRPTQLPRRLGRYDLLEQIGRGGFSTVYRAFDSELRRDVAVKVLRADLLEAPGARDRMFREAHAAARLRHPAIVPIHEVGDDGGETFLVFDFLPGPTLTQLLRDTTPSPQQAAEWMVRLAESLDYAHQNGVIHRDVKPANVMMDERGQPMLTDFGLASHADAGMTLTQHGDILGTPAYMSPEQARGEGHTADARTDVYSLGVLFYEMLCGRVPFQGGGPSVIHKVLNDEPPPPRKFRSHIPLDLETITLKCLAKAPAGRYATAGDLAADLRRWLAGEPIKARPLGPWERGLRWARRRPAQAALVAVALLAILSLVSGSLWYNAKLSSALETAENRRREAEFRREEAQRERQQADTNLYHSLVGQARALRLARGTGYRRQAWSLVKQAASLKTQVRNVDSLRLEAVACLGDFAGLEPTVRTVAEDIRALALSPDGNEFAVGLKNGMVLVQPIESESGVTLAGHRATVFVVVFSLDGATLVTGDNAGTLKVWRASESRTWTCQQTLAVDAAGIAAIALTSDGSKAAVLPTAGTAISLWNLEDGARLRKFEFPEGHAEKLYCHGLALNPAGNLLAAGYRHDQIHGVYVWDVATGSVRQKLFPQLDEIYDVGFSPDGQVLAAGCGIGVALYDTSSFSLRSLSRGDWLGRFAFSADSRLMAFPHPTLGIIRLLGLGTNQEVAALEHPGAPRLAAFGRQSATLVTAGDRSVRIWNLEGTGEKQVLSGHLSAVASLAYSPDGKQLASASADRKVRIHDAAQGTTLRILDVAGPVQALAFAPDGRFLATGDWSGNLQIWETTSWKSQPILDHGLGQFVWSAAFSADGKLFGAAGERGVAVWRIGGDPTKGSDQSRLALELIARPTRDFARVMAFRSQSDLVAWVDHGKNGRPVLHLWDLNRNRHGDLPPVEVAGSIHSLAFSPDGRHVLSVSPQHILNAWNLATLKVDFSLGDGPAEVKDKLSPTSVIALSHDGRRLAAQSGQSVTIWDLQNRKLLLALPEARTIPWSVAWNPDGEELAVGSSDGGVAIWKLPRIQAQLAEIGLGW